MLLLITRLRPRLFLPPVTAQTRSFQAAVKRSRSDAFLASGARVVGYEPPPTADWGADQGLHWRDARRQRRRYGNQPAEVTMSSADASGEPAAEGRDSFATEGPVLVHVWEVEPGQEHVAVGHLDEMLREIESHPGLVAARVLASDDRLSVATVLEMRSVEDRKRLEQLPHVRDTLEHLRGTVNIVVKLYRQVAAYAPD